MQVNKREIGAKKINFSASQNETSHVYQSVITLIPKKLLLENGHMSRQIQGKFSDKSTKTDLEVRKRYNFDEIVVFL